MTHISGKSASKISEGRALSKAVVLALDCVALCDQEPSILPALAVEEYEEAAVINLAKAPCTMDLAVRAAKSDCVATSALRLESANETVHHCSEASWFHLLVELGFACTTWPGQGGRICLAF